MCDLKCIAIVVACLAASVAWADDAREAKAKAEAKEMLSRGKPEDAPDFHFIVVKDDAYLKSIGMTRAQYNAKCPVCATDWRKAWRVDGTKDDMTVYREIRKGTQSPKAGE